MGILRLTLAVALLVSATAACVTVNGPVGDAAPAGAQPGGAEPLPIAGDAGTTPGADADAGHDVAAPGGANDAGPAAGDRGGPGEGATTGNDGGWVIVLDGNGESTYSMSGSGEGGIVVHTPGVTAGIGDTDQTGGEVEPPPANDGDQTDTGTDGGGGSAGAGGQTTGSVGTGDLADWLANLPAPGAGVSRVEPIPGERDQASVEPTHSRPPPPSPPVPVAPEGATAAPPAPPVAAEPVPGEPVAAAPSDSVGAAIDAYLAGLKSAAYTFNPPSPIKVDRPHTVHLWLDPQATPESLADALRAAVPEDAARVEAGETPWSPIMEATLTGGAFAIKAITPARQSISASHRSEWTWEVTATRAGEDLPLYLTLNVILPEHLGPPHTVATLDRRIDVQVTFWWAFDHYFDRYWKWLLGSVGTAFTGVVAWWWKRRSAAAATAAT